MNSQDDRIREFITKLKRIEGELELLREEKKQLFDDFKDDFTPKVIREAVRIAKARMRLGDGVVELDSIIDKIEEVF